ncbi:MAG: MFS transporter, partial [Mycobacteriales bacterium]
MGTQTEDSRTGDQTDRRSAAGSSASAGLFTGGRRAPTVGLLLVITLVAFEAIAVATAMPRAVAALHGLSFYAWPFTAFFVANVVALAVGGEAADRFGTRRPLLAGVAVFTAGLLSAGLAPDMLVFVAGRAVQGFGGGLMIVSTYVVIADVYDAAARPRMFAALSAAWVLPSLIGPVAAGALTQQVSWRAVFLLIAPGSLLALGLIWPTLRRLRGRAARDRPPATRRWMLAVAAGSAVVALQYAGGHLVWWSIVPALAGVAVLVPSLRRLLPAGTLRMHRGIPAAIVLRGVLSGAFFGVDSFVPLGLTRLHGYGPTAAAIPLMVGSLGWSAGAWLQGRLPAAPRHRLIRAGLALIVAGAVGMAALSLPGAPGWLAYPAWLVAGSGMGLAYPSTSVFVLQLSAIDQRGRNGAALQ